MRISPGIESDREYRSRPYAWKDVGPGFVAADGADCRQCEAEDLKLAALAAHPVAPGV